MTQTHTPTYPTLIQGINEPAMSVDITQGTVDMFLKHTEKTLDCVWTEDFAGISAITVLLSGGIDSQFSALLAKKVCSDVNAVIFQFVWDHTVVNAQDVVTAVRFAQAHDIVYTTVDVDIKNCLDNHLLRIAKQYLCQSPQIAVQLFCIEQIMDTWDHDRTMMLGSEIPMVYAQQNTLAMPKYRTSAGFVDNACVETLITKSLLPFMCIAHIYDIKMIRDPFSTSPQALYLGHIHNAQVFSQRNAVIEVGHGLKREITHYKEHYYDLLLPGMMPPLLKRTGFELLRYSMAVESGVYNQFDRVYRVPCKKTAVSGKDVLFKHLGEPLVHGPIDQVMQICQQALDSHQPKPCNLYVFDW